jgi:hypothetical protein
MRLTGPYYRITIDHGTIYVPKDTIPDLRTVVGKLSECARVKAEDCLHAIEANEGVVTGTMFPSSVDGWHVSLRITDNGLTVPHWLSCQEMFELNVALTQLEVFGGPSWTA